MLQVNSPHFRAFLKPSRESVRHMRDKNQPQTPRFMTDAELRLHFGLSERALTRLRATGLFPRKDQLVGKTDRKLVDSFFDHRAGIAGFDPQGWFPPDGEEHFD